VLFADEAFNPGDDKTNKQNEAILKTLITEDTLFLEQKGIDAEPVSNFIHMLVASNERFAVPVGEMDRRLFILEVGDERKEDFNFFERLKQQCHGPEGQAALLNHLLTMNIQDFNVRDVPKTAAHAAEQINSASADDQAIISLAMDGKLPGNPMIGKPPSFTTSSKAMRGWLLARNGKLRDYSDVRLANLYNRIKFLKDQKELRGTLSPTDQQELESEQDKPLIIGEGLLTPGMSQDPIDVWERKMRAREAEMFGAPEPGPVAEPLPPSINPAPGLHPAEGISLGSPGVGEYEEAPKVEPTQKPGDDPPIAAPTGLLPGPDGRYAPAGDVPPGPTPAKKTDKELRAERLRKAEEKRRGNSSIDGR
jgi:hypothetical protein